MCLCYLFSAKTAWQLVNRNADFFSENESILIDSLNESNRIDSNRELECSTVKLQVCLINLLTYLLTYLA